MESINSHLNLADTFWLNIFCSKALKIIIAIVKHLFKFNNKNTRTNFMEVVLVPLKLVSAIFYQFFLSAIFCVRYFFSPNDSPSKTINNVFYFIRKALFVLEIFRFLYFFPSFPQFPDSEGQMEVE